MAVELFGVTADDVLDAMPVNVRGVTAGSSGLNTTKITTWIKNGAGQINALLERAQIDIATAATADSPAREVARDAIISYAVAQALEVSLNNPEDPRITRAWERWRTARNTLKDYPNDIGAAITAEARVKHNVNINAALPGGSFRNTQW